MFLGGIKRQESNKDETNDKFMCRKINERIADIEYEKKLYTDAKSYLFIERDRIENTLKSLVDDGLKSLNDGDTDDFNKLNEVIELIKLIETVNNKINVLRQYIADDERGLTELKSQLSVIV